MALIITPLPRPFHFAINKDGEESILAMGITMRNGIITPELTTSDGSLITSVLDDVYMYLGLTSYLPSKEQELDRILYELEQPHLWSFLFPTDVLQYSCPITVTYKEQSEEVVLHYGEWINRPLGDMESILKDKFLWCNFDLVGDMGADWYRKTLEFKGFMDVFQRYLGVLEGHTEDIKQVEAYVYLLSHHQIGLLEHYGQVQSIMSLPDFLQTNQYYAEMELLWN